MADTTAPRTGLVDSSSQTVFLRKSSGLIRAFSCVDGLIYNIYAISVIGAAILIFSLVYIFPKENLPLGIVIQRLLLIPGCLLYAMLTTMMPRAGGDCVWQSRI